MARVLTVTTMLAGLSGGQRLAMARDAGCDLAATNTLPGTASQRNAERAGFRVAYTKAVVAKNPA